VIAAAILAAGGSRRLGRPKQLLPVQGTTLVELIAARVCATSCDRIALVVGAHAAEVAARVERYGIEILDNPDWQEGISSSVRAAARWARRIEAQGLLLCVVDQPKLSTGHLDELVDTFRQSGDVVASRYANTLGVPAVFDAGSFDELEALAGDRGARSLLGRAGTRVVDWPEGAIDIDVPADLAWA
jgi:xanthine dehydrogenase accessory factor